MFEIIYDINLYVIQTLKKAWPLQPSICTPNKTYIHLFLYSTPNPMYSTPSQHRCYQYDNIYKWAAISQLPAIITHNDPRSFTTINKKIKKRAHIQHQKHEYENSCFLLFWLPTFFPFRQRFSLLLDCPSVVVFYYFVQLLKWRVISVRYGFDSRKKWVGT